MLRGGMGSLERDTGESCRPQGRPGLSNRLESFVADELWSANSQPSRERELEKFDQNRRARGTLCAIKMKASIGGWRR